MIVENKFLYSRVLETNGDMKSELTFAGALLVVLGCLVVAVATMLVVFPILTHYGIAF